MSHATNPPIKEPLIQVLKGDLAIVEMELKLYRLEGKDEFFLCFRVFNTSDKVIGVDLRNYWNVIYPNKWGIRQNEHDLDEKRLLFEEPTAQEKAELIKQFDSGYLVIIQPRETEKYFRDFNGAGFSELEKTKTRGDFVKILLDGQLRVTDGKKVEALHFADQIKEIKLAEARSFTIPIKQKIEDIDLSGSILMNQSNWGPKTEGWQAAVFSSKKEFRMGESVLIVAALKRVMEGHGRVNDQNTLASWKPQLKKNGKIIQLSEKGKWLLERPEIFSRAVLHLKEGQVSLGVLTLNEKYDFAEVGDYSLVMTRNIWKKMAQNRPEQESYTTIDSNGFDFKIIK